MTTITDTLKNVGGELQTDPVVFFIPQPRSSTNATITMKRFSVPLVNGAFSVNLEPGPVVAQVSGRRKPFIVPASGSFRMGALIDAYLPPTTSPDVLAEAVAAYFAANPPSGGGSGYDGGQL